MSLGKTGNTHNNLVTSGTNGAPGGPVNRLRTLDNNDNEDDVFDNSAYGNKRPESARVRLPLRDSLMHHQHL